MPGDQTSKESTPQRAPLPPANFEVTGAGSDSLGPEGMRPAWLSRITSSYPSVVSKVHELVDGKLEKSISANISAGIVETQTCRDLHEFADLLVGLRSNQCLSYGVPQRSPVRLMTERAWTEAGRPQDALSRTDRNFHWKGGEPGILMLDHDPQPGMRYEPQELVDLLRCLVPCLADVDMLTWPSASSLIFDATTEECLSSLKGSRVYLMVDRAECVPALGSYIVQALWSAGHGVFAVSRSGRLLERGVFDSSVWQPSRIDFAAGAICEAPVEQRRGRPVLHRGNERLVRPIPGSSGNASLVPTLSPTEAEAAESFIATARKAAAPAAAEAAARYSDERTRALEAALAVAGCQPEVARARARSVIHAMLRPEAPELHGDALVTVVHDGGTHEELSVSEILKQRSRLCGAVTLDPLEPEYNGSCVVGKLYLTGPVPRLFSFAHGGATYKLLAQYGEVEVITGSLHQTVDQTLALLRLGGDLYDHGDALATVSAEGRLVPITPGLVPYALSSRAAFYAMKRDARTHELKRHDLNPPGPVCTSIYELNRHRDLPKLNAVITAPVIVGERLIERNGYDPTSGLLLVMSSEEGVLTAAPNVEEVSAAFQRLLSIFDTFPFESSSDRGVLLAAIFTAVMRPGLRTAPGFALDAPAQGSGKTLLSECIAIVGTGSAPSALPHLHDDESEVRKRVVSLLHAGTPVMIWDNIKGTFDSPVLASLLTAPKFDDRLLGETRLLSLPNRMLALFNGNNMTLRGELTRRILVCRLDAGVERPYLRSFAASPRDFCHANRLAIVRDVLTVIRGYQLRGGGFAAEVSLGSFEDWSRGVLRPLLWAIDLVGDIRIDDPLNKLAMGEDEDEELIALAELHRAWHSGYGEKPMTAREVIDDLYGGDCASEHPDLSHAWREQLRDAIDDLVGPGTSYMTRTQRTRALGKQLGYRKDRVVDGNRRFTKRMAGGGLARWSAAMIGGSERGYEREWRHV